MENLKINAVDIGDIDQLREIGVQTFRETFLESNSEKDMVQYLQEAFSIEKLRSEMNNPGSQFYLAVLDKEAVRYLKVNIGQSQTELKNNQSLEIERIYVLKKYHGKKVGQALLEKAHELAQQSKVDFIWLGVWEKNHRALRFYKKNGFLEFGTHIFKLGNDEQTDIMMRKLIE